MTQIHKNVIFFISLLNLWACETTPNPFTMPDGDYRDSLNNIPYSASTPLRDFNIVTQAPPDQLVRLRNPYGTDTFRTCRDILRETQDLRHALMQIEQLRTGPQHNHNTRAGYVGKLADDTVTDLATSFIPFRGTIRRLSGAKQRERILDENDRLGRERLGFLVGIGTANRCPGFFVPYQPLRP